MKSLQLVIFIVVTTSAVPVQDVSRRGILDGLASLAGKGTKLGTAMEVLNALAKVNTVIGDLKQVNPMLHKALNASLTDVHFHLNNLIDDLLQQGSTGGNAKRGLLDGLLGKGTKLGTAMEVLNALAKVNTVIGDLKQVNPMLHKALNASLTDVHFHLNNLIDDLLQQGNTGGNAKRGLLDGLLGKGTKLGTAMEVLNALAKVNTVIGDLKQVNPMLHKALNASLTDVHFHLNNLIDDLLQQGSTGGNTKRGLLDGLLGKGTKLGTALEVLNALGKVSTVVGDLKQVNPLLHKALNQSLTDVHFHLNKLIDDLLQQGNTGGNAKRGLLDGLLGKGTKLGTAMEVLNALAKVNTVIGDLKQVNPMLHKALNASLTDVHFHLNNLIDDLLQQGSTGGNAKRGLLDGLLGKGTKLGTALEVLNALGKVSTVVGDLKQVNPLLHKALNQSLTDVHFHLNKLIDDLLQQGSTGGNAFKRGLLDGLLGKGTKLGTAMEVLNALAKVNTVIGDLKQVNPMLHKALNASLTDVHFHLNNLIDDLLQQGSTGGNAKRGLLDGLLGKGTKLGTALEVLNALGKVKTVVDDLKQVNPLLHKTINASLVDVHSHLSSLIDALLQISGSAGNA